ncbi:unnamed protein product [Bursaphelenchus okinawaensis]|uniref:Uncharacterized protein n=1 Tax=Bursaphelenchus okinawaensis TaxID=465554 RepID=A0A811K941_9BILA|nr:unnamed protein product [Bursaphelenchus okinawaensis]CAG9094656.1 unnamed protein product [Bursaphelenchus okinawaensis]
MAAKSIVLIALAVLLVALELCHAYPREINLARRDSDLDSLASEFKFKGGRMRFGKRSKPDKVVSLMEDPMYYTADRYMWLQVRVFPCEFGTELIFENVNSFLKVDLKLNQKQCHGLNIKVGKCFLRFSKDKSDGITINNAISLNPDDTYGHQIMFYSGQVLYNRMPFVFCDPSNVNGTFTFEFQQFENCITEITANSEYDTVIRDVEPEAEPDIKKRLSDLDVYVGFYLFVISFVFLWIIGLSVVSGVVYVLCDKMCCKEFDLETHLDDLYSKPYNQWYEEGTSTYLNNW